MPRRTLRARINAGGCRNEGGCSPPAATQGVHCQSTVERSCHVPQDAAHQPVRHRAARGGGPAPRGAPRSVRACSRGLPHCGRRGILQLRHRGRRPAALRRLAGRGPAVALPCGPHGEAAHATRHVLQRRDGRCRRRRGGMLDAGGLRGVRRAVDGPARRDAGRIRARPAATVGEARRRPGPRAAVPRHRHRLHPRARVVQGRARRPPQGERRVLRDGGQDEGPGGGARTLLYMGHHARRVRAGRVRVPGIRGGDHALEHDAPVRRAGEDEERHAPVQDVQVAAHRLRRHRHGNRGGGPRRDGSGKHKDRAGDIHRLDALRRRGARQRGRHRPISRIRPSSRHPSAGSRRRSRSTSAPSSTCSATRQGCCASTAT